MISSVSTASVVWSVFSINLCVCNASGIGKNFLSTSSLTGTISAHSHSFQQGISTVVDTRGTNTRDNRHLTMYTTKNYQLIQHFKVNLT